MSRGLEKFNTLCCLLISCCLLLPNARADAGNKLIYASDSTVKPEMLRHELQPVTNYLAEKGWSVEIAYPNNMQQFFTWAQQKKFDFAVTEGAQAYILETYFDYRSIVESIETVDHILVSHPKWQGNGVGGSKALILVNDILSPYYVDAFINAKEYEYHNSIETLLISLIKHGNAASIIDSDDIMMLPQSLRKKLKLGERQAFSRMKILCRKDAPLACEQLRDWIVELSQSWHDPDWRYVFINLYHFRPCCEAPDLISSDVKAYLNGFMAEQYPQLIK